MSISVCITDYGAKADGTIQTGNIQKAIDDCFAKGGGIVKVPSGEFLTGGVRIRSNITLYLESGAILKGTRNPEDYFGWKYDLIEPIPKEKYTNVLWEPASIHRDNSHILLVGSSWNNAIIRGYMAENIAIIGEEGSIIDGCNCYDETGEEHYRGPHGINLHNCKNIALKGYKIQNTGNWAHAIFFSENIDTDNVTVYGGHDGIHLSSCDNIKIQNSHFFCGDDCISGFDNNDVYATGCELNTACSAFRFGGNNVLFEKCHIWGPAKVLFRGCLSDEEKKNGANVSNNGRNNMLSVFTYYSDFTLKVRKQPGNIVIRDCKIENTTRFLHYNFSGNEPWQLNRSLESIKFENLVVDGVEMPIHAYGDAANPATIEFSSIRYVINPNVKLNTFLKCANIKNLSLKDFNVENFEGETVLASWENVENISLDGFSLGDNSEKLVKHQSDKFECSAI